MALVVPKYRVLVDDTDSVKDTLAHGLIKLVEAQNGVSWDLFPFRPAVRQLTFERATRPVTAREVVLHSELAADGTKVVLTAATKARVTDGHILYHPATKQRIVIDEMTQSNGEGTIESVLGVENRAVIAAGQTLYVLSQAENFEEINAESRFEETDKTINYVQDTTELLEWSVADLREARKWGVDQQVRLKERMRDIVKDLNSAILFNAPQAASATKRAVTAGFDYLVEAAGSVVDAAASGTADLADVRGVLKVLQKNGVGPQDGVFALMSIDAYHAYSDAGLQDLQLNGQPGTEFVIGNILKGVNVPGLGFVPFYADPHINDDRVRFIASAHAGKAYYQGENGPLESPKVIDEPSMSNSKVQKSTIQQKWTTIIDNADKAHYILDKTGL